MRAEINEIEMKERIRIINETKSCFFEKVSKIDKTLTRPNIKRDRAKNYKIRNEKEAVTIGTQDIQKIIRDYYE